jgi:hypothetical protein
MLERIVRAIAKPAQKLGENSVGIGTRPRLGSIDRGYL